MAIIKCKMCGGDMEISDDKTFGTCEYCGSTMTLPKIDDEQRAAAFNRGNHFRRIGEFDKALAAYEQIVREDDSDAEAHWCCALCRFGIEYVEDPATFEYVPTCHRASFDSFLEDVDYLAAVEHSDGVTKRQYQKDAVKIADVQKGILATSQKEEPFDVFICYKESDDKGERTVDSTLAQDIYYQLTEQGCRVFFSRITLEDKAGAEYEPYIFAALHSAKVMVAVGTKPEHFNAVWVKNEWSRFLSLMRHDRSKLLIPCYRDMDPYDLPEQLSVLQSYDMSKIGFIQDLIRGIGKVLHKDDPKIVKETVVVQQTPSVKAEAAPLLKRAFMFLEDGDWERADDFCEQVLNMNPECAEAYLGKLMAELCCSKQDKLKEQEEPFDENSNYEKAIRFADQQLKTELTDCIQYINDRNERARLNGIYEKAQSAMEKSKTEDDFKQASKIFRSIAKYEDSSVQAEKCLEKAETVRKDTVYASAKEKMVGEKIPDYEEAIETLKTISGWKDAEQQITVCQNKIKEIEKNAEQKRLNEEKQKKKARKIVMIVTPIICLCIAFGILLQTVIIPSRKLEKAEALIESGDYIAARDLLSGLNYQYNEEKLQEITTKYYKTLWGDPKVGDVITFGTYEQDNDFANRKEDIEWQVLDRQDQKFLVISKYALDYKQFNTEYKDITWEKCTLRTWLNGGFLNTAFTTEEQKLISTVTVSAVRNPKYHTDPGNDTQDKIFLLSIPEAVKYFPSDDAMICKPTPYAIANNTHESNSGSCWWWLRSPGYGLLLAACVYNIGGVDAFGYGVNSDGCSVRPAMWIDLEP